jgi:pentatricopeptide repeat protein
MYLARNSRSQLKLERDRLGSQLLFISKRKTSTTNLQSPNANLDSILKTCFKNGNTREVLLHLDDIIQKKIHLPDPWIKQLVNSCTNGTQAQKLMQLIQVNKTFKLNNIDCIQLIKAIGPSSEVMKVVDLMDLCGVKLDSFSYALLFKTVSSLGLEDQANVLYDHIRRAGVPLTIAMHISLLTVYTKTGNWDKAYSVLNDITTLYPSNKDPLPWNILLSSLVKNYKIDKSLELFESMLQSSAIPSDSTWATVLKAAGLSQNAKLQQKTLDFFIKHQERNPTLLTNFRAPVISLMTKSGRFNSAVKLFEEASQGSLHTHVWNSMLAGYRQHKKPEDVWNLFDRMQRLQVTLSWIG